MPEAVALEGSPQPESRHARGRFVLAIKVLAFLLFIILLARALARADWEGTAARLGGVGPAVLLVLVPFPLALALDSTAWKLLFARLGIVVSFPRVWHVRFMTEAATVGLPAGGLAAEALG